ncbi:Tyrosine kinase specific for activated [Ceratobasidium sp. AG-Ba]|nr:Tyrosine kinase specific for activated [Ceratobasidium sp. AG-Ba]QRW01193.1 Tyrosine kinase specific for activated [Ceratobasidium sp. AG-Ba]
MSSTLRPPEVRSDAEMRWVSLQPYLLSRGYQLRPRYQPDWTPSWTVTGADPRECEDSTDVLPFRTLDATRIHDQQQVMIKILTMSEDDREGEQELEILQYFSTSPYNNDSTNHIIPCLDTFSVPDVEGGMFFVMPLLGEYKTPPFYDLSEIHEFLSQIFEGLEFLHNHNIAHWYTTHPVLSKTPLAHVLTTFSDIASDNIVMNRHVLFDEPVHPFHQNVSLDGQRVLDPRYVRSQKPVRYYYIDFGFAKWFKDPTAPQTVTGAHAKERAPEQQPDASYDPFKVDIYQLGAIIRRDLIPVRVL